MYDLGIVGNCNASALVSREGEVVWMCLPRPDAPPVFGKLLDAAGGSFSIRPVHPLASAQQEYIENTCVLTTRITDTRGNSFEITDFFPRFEQYHRTYRPLQFFRIVRPLAGMPRVRLQAEPVLGWTKEHAERSRGNSHIRFLGYADQLRLTTSAPLTYILDSQEILLTEPLYFALTWGVPLEDDIGNVAQTFLSKTVDYWRGWVRGCAIPSQFQKEVIRSALTLKLHCYDETGAILASVSSSLPEIPGEVRNWDYRFCWIRDAYFTVSALHRLGHYDELMGVLKFLLALLRAHELNDLSPVYTVDGGLPLPELLHEGWAGHGGGRPVRSGNQAAEHVQNDVYGELLLALCPIFFDARFSDLRTPQLERDLRTLALKCHRTLGQSDAGLWELRAGWKVHNFTTLMSWAGLERYERIVRLGLAKGDAAEAATMRDEAAALLEAAAQGDVVTNAKGEDVTDASLCLLSTLRYPNERLVEGTLTAIAGELCARDAFGAPSAFFFRYRYKDDFGNPAYPFLVCSFWYIEAIARQGRRQEARKLLEDVCRSANHLGLFSEHFDHLAGHQTGNFPQCYSHVGLIHCAFAVSEPWDAVL
jgi:GH15 family glucan-1,4-alpha-glucosidase